MRDRFDAQGAARAVARQFAMEGQLESLAPLGRGHIHDTFELRFRREQAEAPTARFVLQRINDHVFRAPLDVMRNVEEITRHLDAKLAGTEDAQRRCLRLVAARDGGHHVVDERGAVWRAYPFIEGSRALDRVESQAQAFAVARAFGEFVALLADLAPERLLETIPNFHDLPSRHAALTRAAARNAARRDLAALAEDLDRARCQYERLCEAQRSLAPLPRRVVHNDCKLNNVLLDERTGAPLCVIDLDTVMEGTLLADFGELARTAANPAAEDESDLSRVDFDLACFDALARGYLAGLGETLTPAERSALPLAGPLLALENGVRFLTDHLDGDVYFPAQREGHNLDRARCQLTLVDHMLERLDEAGRCVAAASESG